MTTAIIACHALVRALCIHHADRSAQLLLRFRPPHTSMHSAPLTLRCGCPRFSVLSLYAAQLGLTGLPDSLPDVSTLTKDKDADLLRRLHQVLVEVRFNVRPRSGCMHRALPNCSHIGLLSGPVLCAHLSGACFASAVGFDSQTFVQEGSLTCGKCGRSYPIQQGIPNMRLNEDEVRSMRNRAMAEEASKPALLAHSFVLPAFSALCRCNNRLPPRCFLLLIHISPLSYISQSLHC